MPKKVALIIPPSPFLLDERVFPFLGILRVAAAWEMQRPDLKIEVVDLGGIENYLDVISDYIDGNRGELEFVGVTFTTPQTPNAVKVAQQVRKVAPPLKIVAGGSHPTLMHTAMKREHKRGVFGERAERDVRRLQKVFDVLVCGDGEFTLEAVLGMSSGVVDVDDRTSPLFLNNQTFSETPNPARHLIDLSSYNYTIEGAKATSLISQLGCPYQCIAGFERVATEHGLIRIDDIVVDSIFSNSKQGAFEMEISLDCEKGVSKTSHGLNQGIQKSNVVKLKNGMTLTAHPEHRIRVIRDGSLIWEEVSKLTNKDVAVIQAGSNVYPPRYRELYYEGYEDKSINSGSFTIKKQSLPKVLDEDLAWILGMFIGDGSSKRSGLTFAVVEKTEEKLRNKLKTVFDYDMKLYPIKSTDIAKQAWVYSSEIVDFIDQTFFYGEMRTRKHQVPELIYRSPKSVVESFLEGLWDADGYENGNGEDYLTTASKSFSREVVNLLVHVGVCPSVWELENKEKKTLYYRVSKSKWDVVPHKFGAYWGRDRKPRFRKSFAGKSGIRKEVFRQIDPDHETFGESWFYVPVEEVSDSIDRVLFDLTVPGPESYISSGFISHNCTFCSGRNSPYLRKIRNRTVDSVVDEIEQLYLNYGYQGFMFYDDELNVNKEMVPLMNKIADLGQKYGVEWQLRGFTKSELFNDEQAKAMKRAGFKILLTGFESGDDKILTNIRKRASRDDNTRCVEIAKRHGLKVKALMSMGHAGESHETIENTKKWLMEVEPDDFDCTVITCYPGSPYFDDAVKTGDHYTFTSKDSGDKLYQSDINYTKEVDHYKGVPGEYHAFVWTDFLSPSDLVVERDKLEKEVRAKLGIEYNPANPARKYEHSMGSTRNLPDWIVRDNKSFVEKRVLPKTEDGKIRLNVL